MGHAPPVQRLALDAVRVALHADLAVVVLPGTAPHLVRIVARAGEAAFDLPAEFLAPSGPGRYPALMIRAYGTTAGHAFGPTVIVPVAHPGIANALLVVARTEGSASFEDVDLVRARRLAATANGALYDDPRAAGHGIDAVVPDTTFVQALDVAAVGMSLVDADLRYRWVNVPLCVMLDRAREELVTLSVTDTVHPEHVGRAMAFYDRLRHGDFGAARDRLMFHRPDGRPVWGELGGSAVPDSGDPPLFFVQQFDVTAEQELTDDLAYRAMHDDLTGLATRTLLRDRMMSLLARTQRSGARAVAFYLDIDQFKSINDRYGHVVGDLVLSETALRLNATVRAGDTVARVGGDEFVIAGEATGVDEAARLAHRLREAIEPPVNVGAQTIRVEASVGVALSSRLDTPEDLVARADRALLRLKQMPQLHVVPAAPA